MNFLWFAIIGIVVGFLAGQYNRGRRQLLRRFRDQARRRRSFRFRLVQRGPG
jgi:hypothetical protein